jgi:hypothetical protein
MSVFLSAFSSVITEQPALKYILPALITALVGIIGMVLQFITSMYIQKQQRWENRAKSLKDFFIPLQKHLNSLNILQQAFGLSYDEIISSLSGNNEEARLLDSTKKDICKIYEDMGNLFLSGIFSYFNKKVYDEIIQLRNHVYSVNLIRKLTIDVAGENKKIPSMPDISPIIKEIDKLLIKT